MVPLHENMKYDIYLILLLMGYGENFMSTSGRTRLVMPRVNLSKLYQYLTGEKTKFSDYAMRNFERFITRLCEATGISKESLATMNFIEFLDTVRRYVFDNLQVGKVLEILKKYGLPATSASIIAAYRVLGFRVSVSSAQAILSLLRQLGLVTYKRFPYPTANDDEKIIGLLLVHGSMRFSELCKELKLDRSRMKLAVLRLLVNGRVKIEDFEMAPDLIKVYLEQMKIPEFMVKRIFRDNIPKYLVRYEERSTGEIVYKIEIPDDSIVLLHLRV